MSAAPAPPNLRDAPDGSDQRCATCKMYDDGECWGYGNYDVAADEVCDSYSREQIPDEAQARATSLRPATYNMQVSRSLVESVGHDWQDPVEFQFLQPRDDQIEMMFRRPRIDILRADDWVALYRDGRKVREGHSVPLDDALEALGFDAQQRWVEPGGWDEGAEEHYYAGDEFPETL